MEGYKRYLCSYFNPSCRSVDTIYGYIKNDSQYTYNLNENDKLHSNYTGTYYEPAIIFTARDHTYLFWLFDGEIKDCVHPFYIRVIDKQIYQIVYYSSERIQTDQPICIDYRNKKCLCKIYNRYYLDVPRYMEIESGIHAHVSGVVNEYYDESMFTPEFYPLCDNMDGFRFKFAD